jgi:hypothetical protein
LAVSKAQALALLQRAARKGLGQLRLAWKALSPAAQKVVAGEKERLKAIAQEVRKPTQAG